MQQPFLANVCSKIRIKKQNKKKGTYPFERLLSFPSLSPPPLRPLDKRHFSLPTQTETFRPPCPSLQNKIMSTTSERNTYDLPLLTRAACPLWWPLLGLEWTEQHSCQKKGKRFNYYFIISLSETSAVKRSQERKMENNHLHSDVLKKKNKQKQTQCSGNAGFLLQV